MDIFPLALFPPTGLSSSVITTVCVGVFVIAYFNLRFGWVLSGLVVPGYLVPLMLVKPWSAAVVIVESFVTYFLVWLFSEYLSRWALWNNFFGRDRFFALILCSVLVRMVLDVWLFPHLGEALNAHWDIAFNYRNYLHSFGLIIVALIANQFWKTGWWRGMPPFVVTLTITFVIVRYGLMELTNFSISNLGYMYEDMASSMLASPKAYIILIFTAFLASRMNLNYGWDFNGILIPALLALQWYQPLKILTTFVESGVILLAANVLLRASFFKKITIEGARKLLLFFNIGFAYNFILGYLFLWWLPEVKVTDYYGFGYLLSTLIAIKIHDKGILARYTRATLQTSLAGVLLASMVGFALTFLPREDQFAATRDPTPAVLAVEPDQTLRQMLLKGKISLYQSRINDGYVAPRPSEIAAFERALHNLLAYITEQDDSLLQLAVAQLAQVHYQILLLQERYIYLRESPPARGWGIYAVDMQTDHNMLVEVPAPLNEPGVVEAGLSLFDAMHAKALAIAGTSRTTKGNASADVLANRQTFFHSFQRVISGHDVLQVRSYSPETARALMGVRRSDAEIDMPGLPTLLWVKEALPSGLSLVTLKKMLGQFQLEWGSTPMANTLRDASRIGFAELILNKKDRRRILSQSFALADKITPPEAVPNIEGYLQEWLLSRKTSIADQGTNRYNPPGPEELLFFDEAIIVPLLTLIRNHHDGQHWSRSDLDELSAIASAAAGFGYRIIRYRHRATEHDYLVLAEEDGSQSRRHWGLYVFRLGPGLSYLVQVPRPLFEKNSFEFGVALFDRLNAKALMVAGAHPFANRDRQADVVDPRNKANLFNLFSQALLREASDTPVMVVQSRAFGYRSDRLFPAADALLSMDRGIVDRDHMSLLGNYLVGALQQDGLTVKLVDGSQETAGYEGVHTAQALYMNATSNKELSILWLSPWLRSGYRQQTENRWQDAQFRALGIETEEVDLTQFIDSYRSWGNARNLDEKLRQTIEQYIVEHDVLRLQAIQTDWPEYPMTRLIDKNTRQTFVLLYNTANEPLLVANLLPRLFSSITVNRAQDSSTVINDFVDKRIQWLELVPE